LFLPDCIGDYDIRLKFNDGMKRFVDFKSFLSKPQNPAPLS